MTTLKDYIRNAVVETQKKFIEVNALDDRLSYLPLTEEQIEEIVEEELSDITKRLIGQE